MHSNVKAGSGSDLQLFLVPCLSLVTVVIFLITCLDWRKFKIFSGFNFGRLKEGPHNANESSNPPPFPELFNPNRNVAFDILPEIEINIPGSDEHLIYKSLRPKIYTEKSLQKIDIDEEINSILVAIDSKCHVDRSFIQPNNLMGKSIYGEVILATMKNKNVFTQCILTSLSLDENITPTLKLNYWKELSAYREIRHKNVLSFLKVNIEQYPYWSLLEYCHLGDMKSYLIAHSAAKESLFQKGLLVKFALDVATGLDALHNHKYIHRDLSARNCLVTSDFTVKIGDYGLAEEKFPADYFKWQNYALPIRWMAPESLHFDGITLKLRKLSKVANIWSFGIVMTELVTFGEQPYPEWKDEEVLSHASQNALKSQSNIAPQTDKLHHVRHSCMTSASKRPNLQSIINQLTSLRDDKSPTTVNVLKLNETLSNSGSPCEFADIDDAFAAESVINDNFSFSAITLSIEPAMDDVGSDEFDTNHGGKNKISSICTNELADIHESNGANQEKSKESNVSEGMFKEGLNDFNENYKKDANMFQDGDEDEFDKIGKRLLIIPPCDIHHSDQGSDSEASSGRSSKLSVASKIVNIDEGSLNDNNSKLLNAIMHTNEHFSLELNDDTFNLENESKDPFNQKENLNFSGNFSDVGVTLMADDAEDVRINKGKTENALSVEEINDLSDEDDDIDDINISEDIRNNDNDHKISHQNANSKLIKMKLDELIDDKEDGKSFTDEFCAKPYAANDDGATAQQKFDHFASNIENTPNLSVLDDSSMGIKDKKNDT